MSTRKTLALLTAFILLLFAPVLLFSANQENPLVAAIKLFDQQKYEKAETILTRLIKDKPDNLMLNYYYGACRTENQHFGQNEINSLLKGSSGEAPLKADYYLGIQHHAKKDWETALEYYGSFKGKTGPEEQARVKLNEKIQQCNDKYSPYSFTDETVSPESDLMSTEKDSASAAESKNLKEGATDILPKPLERANEPDTATLTKKQESKNIAIAGASSNINGSTPKSLKQKTAPINFFIDGEITYLDKTHFKTAEGLKLFESGKSKEELLNNKNTQVDLWRTQYADSNSNEEQKILSKKILSSENEIYSLQVEINNNFALAKQKELEYWDTTDIKERSAFIKELDNYFNREITEENDVTLPDSLLILSTVNNPLSTKPGASEEETGQELVYKIQLGAYRRGLPAYVKRLFDKLSNIRKIENYTDEKGIVVYTTGNLTNYEDAVKMQNQVRREGVEGAYVVPYFNGKRITLKEAKELADKK